MKTVSIKVTDIVWDTDGEIIEGLPTEVAITDIEEDDLEDECFIADWLSDEFG